jgi:hypothetical protein
MASRLMSDAEVRRRKKMQGHISQTTSTLGLGGLGVTGVAALAAKKPGVLRAVQKIPKMKNATPKKMKDTAINTGIVSGGISGVGGYNFAAYTNAESRRRQQKPVTPVKKEIGMDMGYFGEEGHPVKLPEIKVPIEKAWTPVAGNYDSESKRGKRSEAYQAGALAAGGAGAAYSAPHAVKAVKASRKVKPKVMAEVQDRTNSAGKPYKIALGSQGEKAIPLKALKAVGHHGGRAAAGAAVTAGAVGAHQAIKRKREGSWQSYGKRDGTSAFGVDHTEWTAP